MNKKLRITIIAAAVIVLLLGVALVTTYLADKKQQEDVAKEHVMFLYHTDTLATTFDMDVEYLNSTDEENTYVVYSPYYSHLEYPKITDIALTPTPGTDEILQILNKYIESNKDGMAKYLDEYDLPETLTFEAIKNNPKGTLDLIYIGIYETEMAKDKTPGEVHTFLGNLIGEEHRSLDELIEAGQL